MKCVHNGCTSHLGAYFSAAYVTRSLLIARPTAVSTAHCVEANLQFADRRRAETLREVWTLNLQKLYRIVYFFLGVCLSVDVIIQRKPLRHHIAYNHACETDGIKRSGFVRAHLRAADDIRIVTGRITSTCLVPPSSKKQVSVGADASVHATAADPTATVTCCCSCVQCRAEVWRGTA